MQFQQDLFQPSPLSPDLEWMLQSSQVSDRDLAVQLAQDYASRLNFLALLVLGDEVSAARATASSLQAIVHQRSQFWGQVPLRAWVYALALSVIRRYTNLIWRLRRWMDNRRFTPQPDDSPLALRLALLKLEPSLSLPVSLVFGHDLPESEAAQILGIPEEALQAQLAQARQILPEHSPEELTQAAHLGNLNFPGTGETVPTITSALSAELPRLQKRMLGLVLPNLSCQARQGQVRWVTREVVLVGFVMAAALFVGLAAFNMDRLNPEAVTPTSTVNEKIVVKTVLITATPDPEASSSDPGPLTLAQVARPESTSTPAPRKGAVDISSADLAMTMSDDATYDWEDSGPVLLSVLLRYLNEPVDSAELHALLSPNPRDAAVFPYEIEDYIIHQARLRALYRFGGDLETLRQIVDVNLPVLLQKTYSGIDVEGWSSEYALVTGFDDFEQQLTLLTIREGNVSAEPAAYEEFMLTWLPFGYAYFVIFPPDRLTALTQILDLEFSEPLIYAAAMEKIDPGFYSDRVQWFWNYFSAGTLLTYQGEYARAALMYDEAFTWYDRMSEVQRPWRALWYNSRPYWAYYYTNDFERVISLAEETLNGGGDRGLEESLYWRAMARNALGDQAGALADIRSALEVHPQFGPAEYLLETMQTP